MLEPSDPAFLSHARLAIVGLGLMGGSLALALRGQCEVLLGIDPDPETLDLARRIHLVDAAAADPTDLLPLADVIVLAAPVSAILSLLEALPSLHPGPALVLDLGSTKSAIVEAMSRLPERFDPIGGHPMCGKERGGLAQADAALFHGATFAFTPVDRGLPANRVDGQIGGGIPVETQNLASPSSGDQETQDIASLPGKEKEPPPEQNIGTGDIESLADERPDRLKSETSQVGRSAQIFAAALAAAVGAHPLWLDAATHDCWVASTSHLPYLVANALAGCTPLEAAPLVGSGFRSATRLAPTPPGMMMDVLKTNSQNILAAARRFCETMGRIETLLAAGDYAALQELLENGASAQTQLVAANERGNPL